ncbi:hypothetical protein QFZ78_003833 [Paenibacillus sp. V4I5]|nr:hypothetical protein [Paenibacillus sp. V4I5]
MYLLGNGLLFKLFLLIYNKLDEKVVKQISYGIFNKRKK